MSHPEILSYNLLNLPKKNRKPARIRNPEAGSRQNIFVHRVFIFSGAFCRLWQQQSCQRDRSIEISLPKAEGGSQLQTLAHFKLQTYNISLFCLCKDDLEGNSCPYFLGGYSPGSPSGSPNLSLISNPQLVVVRTQFDYFRKSSKSASSCFRPAAFLDLISSSFPIKITFSFP